MLLAVPQWLNLIFVLWANQIAEREHKPLQHVQNSMAHMEFTIHGCADYSFMLRASAERRNASIDVAQKLLLPVSHLFDSQLGHLHMTKDYGTAHSKPWSIHVIQTGQRLPLINKSPPAFLIPCLFASSYRSISMQYRTNIQLMQERAPTSRHMYCSAGI